MKFNPPTANTYITITKRDILNFHINDSFNVRSVQIVCINGVKGQQKYISKFCLVLKNQLFVKSNIGPRVMVRVIVLTSFSTIFQLYRVGQFNGG
jgi:hypothetical protein